MGERSKRRIRLRTYRSHGSITKNRLAGILQHTGRVRNKKTRPVYSEHQGNDARANNFAFKKDNYSLLAIISVIVKRTTRPTTTIYRRYYNVILGAMVFETIIVTINMLIYPVGFIAYDRRRPGKSEPNVKRFSAVSTTYYNYQTRIYLCILL